MAIFEKSERLRHIGHLDLMRATQRALRRSGLPIGYSKGFTPHVQVAFASALATGAWGSRELMDVQLAEGAAVTPEEFVSAMNLALPPEMQISEAKILPDRTPGLMSLVQAAEYDLTLPEGEEKQTMRAALPGFLAQESIAPQRKTKSGMKEVDIRPFIHLLEENENGLHALLRLTEGESCKPDMLLTALAAFCGLETVPVCRVRRLGLYGRNEQGELKPLEELV